MSVQLSPGVEFATVISMYKNVNGQRPLYKKTFDFAKNMMEKNQDQSQSMLAPGQPLSTVSRETEFSVSAYLMEW